MRLSILLQNWNVLNISQLLMHVLNARIPKNHSSSKTMVFIRISWKLCVTISSGTYRISEVWTLYSVKSSRKRFSSVEHSDYQSIHGEVDHQLRYGISPTNVYLLPSRTSETKIPNDG